MDEEIDRLLASLQTPKAPRTTGSQPAPTATATRSGRIPQRPDPNHSSLLDYLIFPEDSESDDPDFDPFNPPNLSLPNNSGPVLDFPIHLGPQSFVSTVTDPVGFDFSTLADNHHPQSNAQENQIHPPSIHHPAHASPSKFSPLTEGAITGVPFININFPESDDSPEFVPPPPILAPCPSSSAKKKTRREIAPRPPDPPTSDYPLSSGSTSSYQNPCSAAPNIDPSLSSCPPVPERTRQEPRQTIRLAPSISSRYVAIAPNPNYPVDRISSGHPKMPNDRLSDRAIEVSDDDEDGESEVSIKNQGGRATGNYSALSRLKPGPKPKSLVRSSSDLQPHLLPDHDDAVKRKREGMRQTRERKKRYIVSLEDRCLELAEENARLKEENQALLKESRENWKSKAKSLEVIHGLTTEIERLKRQREKEESEKILRERAHQERNTKMKEFFPTKEDSSTVSCVIEPDEDGRTSTNKRRRTHDDGFVNPSFRPRGRTLLDLVAVKPR